MVLLVIGNILHQIFQYAVRGSFHLPRQCAHVNKVVCVCVQFLTRTKYIGGMLQATRYMHSFFMSFSYEVHLCNHSLDCDGPWRGSTNYQSMRTPKNTHTHTCTHFIGMCKIITFLTLCFSSLFRAIEVQSEFHLVCFRTTLKWKAIKV